MPPSAVETPRRPLPMLAVLGFSSLCASLMQSLVIPIQGELPHLLNTSASNASWVITATLLGAAVAMPVAGRLADIFGKKRVLLISASILLLGSLLCALFDTLPVILLGRVLQGMAMGYVPVAISMVRDVAPPKMANSAMAAVSATFGVGGSLGLPLSAFIAQRFDWQVLFWVSAVLAVAILVSSGLVLPDYRVTNRARVDLVGATILTVGLVGVLVGVTKSHDWGWLTPPTLLLIIGGTVLLVLWGFHQLRVDQPLVDLRTTVRRPVLLSNLAGLAIGFGMMGQAIVVPQLLQMTTASGYGLGQTIIQTGLWLAPGGLMMMAFSPLSSRLLTILGARTTMAIGASVLGAGYLFAAFMINEPWQLMVANCISSAGVGIGYAAMPTLILDNVPAADGASGVGVNSLMRSIGTAIAGAVMIMVLTGTTTTLADEVIPTRSAFILCFIVGAAAAAVAVVLTLLIPRREAVGAGAGN